MSHKLAFIFVYLSLHCAISATDENIVQFSPCEGESDISVCEVKEVRVNPCPAPNNGDTKPCKFKRLSNATIEFDFVPHFSADTLLGQAYSASFLADLPLIGMERDACKSTKCPVIADQQATYKNTLFVASYFPLSTYVNKWKVWDPNQSSNGCCFSIRIKLVK